MTFESLDSTICIVALMDVRWDEFNSATTAAYGGFALMWSLIVEDMSIYADDFPSLFDGLVCFDEIVGFV